MGRIIRILLVFVDFISLVQSQAVPAHLTAKPALVRVFSRLEDKGERDIAQAKANFSSLRQFISFTVISEREILDSTAIVDSRIQTIINTKRSPENSPCTGLSCKKVHGEIQAIYDGKLTSAIETFQTANENTKPVVVLFSHYIPCYGIKKGVKYSCAEELSNFFYAYQNRIEMIVVYRDVYKETEKKMAIRYMTADGIDVYEKIGKSKYTKQLLIGELTDIQNGRGIFQTMLFNCLKDPDEIFKCTMTCVGSDEDADRIIAYFVNLLTHSCTRDIYKSARLSNLTKQELLKCMQKNTDEELGTDCSRCPNTQDFSPYVKICITYATHHARYVGFNKSPFDPYSTNWIQKPMLWKDLYRKDFHTFAKARPAVYCAFRQVKTESLCTKIRNSPKLDRDFKIKIRDLKSDLKKRNY